MLYEQGLELRWVKVGYKVDQVDANPGLGITPGSLDSTGVTLWQLPLLLKVSDGSP